MSELATINFNGSSPPARNGYRNVQFQGTAGAGTRAVSAYVPNITEISLASYIPGSPGNFTVPHGLGVTPQLAIVQLTSDPLTGGIGFQATRYDATNVYLTSYGTSPAGFLEVWAP